jgi:hypothetical protein
LSKFGARVCCSLCLIDGIWSDAVKGWDGIPICREHLAQTLVRTSGHPVIDPSPGLTNAPPMLQ